MNLSTNGAVKLRSANRNDAKTVGRRLSRQVDESERSASNQPLNVLKPSDYASDQEIFAGAPGCGDCSILAQMKKVIPLLGAADRSKHQSSFPVHSLQQPVSAIT